ncbi:hypothetical protein EVJ50_11660 [Synechococcus sp. RSCCF101]|uniref:TFIIB-type zinc ribbon-containing protein n=1 Tax=Synechococcus sp. RSCCF101 TaxID=2511069 RepID=UPI0012455861|nr:zf-TFIIB domain-containing protein [Synechococcus sp. RSCCF101]QEY32789.1 hypothetical protein EVJ50_11660 [Synechococcus sp. RSCCF101]
MNCPCCAAPLASGSVVCAYCGHRQDLDLRGLRTTRVESDGAELRCPDCDEPLQRLRLGDDTDAPAVDRCPSCLGLFLTRSALDRVLRDAVLKSSEVNHRLLEALLQEPRQERTPVMRYRPCPVCGTLMHRRLHGSRSGVITDTCRDHGVWLDAGELRQLMEWQRAGGATLDAERRERREEQRKQQQRQERREVAAAAAALPERERWPARPGGSPLEDDLGDLILRGLGRWLGS